MNIIFAVFTLGFMLNNCKIPLCANKNTKNTKIIKKNELFIDKNNTKNKSKTYIDDFIDSKIAMGAYSLAFNFPKF
tara:strand:+ start:195 stop:422 length:228 start_codon:yes stop_codon:yes gene_type:complete